MTEISVSPRPGLALVRRLWSCVQARDWSGARAVLHDDLGVVWWTSGERFDGADAFIATQARYPEGWTIRLIDCAGLEDGRVLSIVRVDHPPNAFFATSVFRLDGERIAGIDEYWATLESPPAWRTQQAIPGLAPFDPLDDPRAAAP